MTELIAQVVKEITGAQQILLFGSRVAGNVRSDSDYDVLVVLSENRGQKERLRLASRCRRRLAQADVPDYDLGDLTTYAVQARYPDELVEPDVSEVKQYAELAERILNDLRFRIGL